MKLISVNVGLPREVTWKGKAVRTGIFKEPVNARVMVHELNLDGDRQADLTVHGGVDKAVYVYPFEHYDYWRSELPDTELTLGIFGENFTVTGLREEELNIGVHEVCAIALSLQNRQCETNGDSTALTLLQTRDSLWAIGYGKTISRQSSHRILLSSFARGRSWSRRHFRVDESRYQQYYCC